MTFKIYFFFCWLKPETTCFRISGEDTWTYSTPPQLMKSTPHKPSEYLYETSPSRSFCPMTFLLVQSYFGLLVGRVGIPFAVKLKKPNCQLFETECQTRETPTKKKSNMKETQLAAQRYQELTCAKCYFTLRFLCSYFCRWSLCFRIWLSCESLTSSPPLNVRRTPHCQSNCLHITFCLHHTVMVILYSRL